MFIDMHKMINTGLTHKVWPGQIAWADFRNNLISFHATNSAYGKKEILLIFTFKTETPRCLHFVPYSELRCWAAKKRWRPGGGRERWRWLKGIWHSDRSITSLLTPQSGDSNPLQRGWEHLPASRERQSWWSLPCHCILHYFCFWPKSLDEKKNTSIRLYIYL